jgi:hypothetical protein
MESQEQEYCRQRECFHDGEPGKYQRTRREQDDGQQGDRRSPRFPTDASEENRAEQRSQNCRKDARRPPGPACDLHPQAIHIRQQGHLGEEKIAVGDSVLEDQSGGHQVKAFIAVNEPVTRDHQERDKLNQKDRD